jgi:hypothetical protein
MRKSSSILVAGFMLAGVDLAQAEVLRYLCSPDPKPDDLSGFNLTIHITIDTEARHVWEEVTCTMTSLCPMKVEL